MTEAMKTRCVLLLSGGLDSMLAVRLMQRQGIAVEALSFKTVFTCCQDQAGRAAQRMGVPLTVIAQEDDYLELVRRPRFGYGKGANPCVDCRIYMFQRAREFMEQVGAQFVVSGEVVGQRPMSQKRRDLDVISYHADLDDVLLRPLSARLLPPTRPEREGWVDREQLYAFSGRSRKGLIRLARQLGIDEIPSPSSGCALTEPRFSLKVRDLIQIDPQSSRWDFELLKVGRHFRFNSQAKVVVGRHQQDNETLRYLSRLPDATRATLLSPQGFPGPCALLVGPPADDALEFANGLILRYAKRYDEHDAWVCMERRQEKSLLQARPCDKADQAASLTTAQR